MMQITRTLKLGSTGGFFNCPGLSICKGSLAEIFDLPDDATKIRLRLRPPVHRRNSTIAWRRVIYMGEQGLIFVELARHRGCFRYYDITPHIQDVFDRMYRLERARDKGVFFAIHCEVLEVADEA